MRTPPASHYLLVYRQCWKTCCMLGAAVARPGAGASRCSHQPGAAPLIVLWKSLENIVTTENNNGSVSVRNTIILQRPLTGCVQEAV